MYKYIKLIFFSLFLILLSACTKEDKQIETQDTVKIVKTFSLKNQSKIQNWYEYPAEIFPFHSVNMAFEVSGKITDMPYHMGDRVKKDTVIAKLDDTIFKANHQVALANYEKANQDFLRYKKLFDTKAISKSDFEEAKQLKAVRQAELEIARKNLKNTKLLSEFDGVLAKKYVDDYARITAKQPILTLQDNTKLKVKFFIPEKDMLRVAKKIDIPAISKKIKLRVSVGKLDNKAYEAKIIDVATKAEDITRTFEITLLMENPEEKNILPGMSAKVHVSFDHSSDTSKVFIPIQAVFTDSSGIQKVWIVREGNAVFQKEVQTGKIQNDLIQITKGLEGNETVVSSGIKELKVADKIQNYKKLDY